MATKKGITSWFLKDAEYLRNGQLLKDDDYLKESDTYTWFWHNWEGQEKGTILEW